MALESPCSPGTDAGEPDVGAVGLLVVDGPVVCGVFRGEGTGRVVVEPVAVETLVAKPLAGAPEVVVLGASTVRLGSAACPTAAGGLSAAAVTAPDAGPGGLFGLESGGVACGGDMPRARFTGPLPGPVPLTCCVSLRSATAGASLAPGPAIRAAPRAAAAATAAAFTRAPPVAGGGGAGCGTAWMPSGRRFRRIAVTDGGYAASGPQQGAACATDEDDRDHQCRQGAVGLGQLSQDHVCMAALAQVSLDAAALAGAKIVPHVPAHPR